MRSKLTIEEMKDIARSNNGECLSTKYINSKYKLKWKCKEGHVWFTIPLSVKKGHWCPVCGRIKSDLKRRKYSIMDMQKLAEKKGGLCLSTEYKGFNTKLKWKCKKGHEWSASPYVIMKGHWCNKCAVERVSKNQRDTIEMMQEIAKSKGGKCLSKEYITASTRLKWQCSKNHVWEAMPLNVKRGTWCPYCANKYQNLEDLKKIAQERGGKCLAKDYKNSTTKVEWQCSEGHRWYASANNVKRGTWCPICNENINEKLCRLYLENFFNDNFPKKKPKWLINDRNNIMELDGYNKNLKIAFEYQGIQHYKFSPPFHRDKNDLELRKKDDKLKKLLCKDRRITLIDIPYTVAVKDLQEFILNECKNKGFKINDNIKPIKLDNLKIFSPQKLKRLKEIAHKRGGDCLSQFYLNRDQKLTWICDKGHIWETSSHSITHGSWCPTCVGKKRLTINEMRKIAESKGGKCLSNEYKNNQTKLQWQCSKGHKWFANAGHIKQGKWCPLCAPNRKLSLVDMKRIANSHGGKCISRIYVNSQTKLEWECSKGHRWKSKPNHIMQGHWCPICSKRGFKNEKK